MVEIVELFAGVRVKNDRPDRHLELDRFPVVPGPVAAFAMPAALCLVFGIEAEMKERVDVFAGYDEHVAAAAAIATARPATRNVLLPAEGQAAVAAVTRFDIDFDFVDEHQDGKKFGQPLRHRRG